MAQITRDMCDEILKCFREKRHYGLTPWEAAQLAYAWMEREDASEAAAQEPQPVQRESKEELSIEWTASDGMRHWATPSHALEVLKLFYDEWPGGVGEFEAEKRAATTTKAGDTALLLTAIEEALASLDAGMAQGAADTLREALEKP